jgi:hypothetical protein
LQFIKTCWKLEDSLTPQAMCNMDGSCQVLVLLGSTPLRPREIYKMNFTMSPTGK